MKMDSTHFKKNVFVALEWLIFKVQGTNRTKQLTQQKITHENHLEIVKSVKGI